MPPKRKTPTKRKASASKEKIAKKQKKEGKESPKKQRTPKQDAKTKKDRSPSPAKKSKKPTSIQDQILAILADATKPLGLPTLKKELISQFDRKDTTQFRNAVKAALKSLSSSDRDDFGVVGASYHGGAGSPAGQKIEAAAAKEAERLAHAENDELECPWCYKWSEAEWLDEMYDARGSSYRCASKGCKRVFYISINCDEPLRKYIPGSKW
eukprot:TRINITY_DN79357_c0_g1_i1.p1 TRINITY_DN79357_c0_g1~~TRINITY_DN79357_c0_g1_i1.p1  ORF type:complete len:211 (-),score=31.55 TRINITY_DN79357_c0_g1_i1:46-678(-)